MVAAAARGTLTTSVGVLARLDRAQRSWSESPVNPLPPPPSAPVQDRLGPILELVGAGAVIAGSLLPWATVTTIFGTIGVNGTEGDGVITLGLGGVLGVLALVELSGGSSTKAIALVVAIITLALGGFEYVSVGDRLGDAGNEFARASVGVGIYVIMGGAGLALFGCQQSRVRK